MDLSTVFFSAVSDQVSRLESRGLFCVIFEVFDIAFDSGKFEYGALRWFMRILRVSGKFLGGRAPVIQLI